MKAHSESASLNHRYYLLVHERGESRGSSLVENIHGLQNVVADCEGAEGAHPSFYFFAARRPPFTHPFIRPTSHCACPIVSSLQGRIALHVSLFPLCGVSPLFFFVYRCASITSERGVESRVGDQICIRACGI